ncbi:MAG TPA: GTP 3',8-cyclase MoaA [Vicinamibacterales bacterium]
MSRDVFGRRLRSLRLSVTDRCNLRCAYCMPEPEYVWLPRGDLLTFEELDRLVDVFIGLGVDRVRLTGGEPLLRRDLPDLVARLARKPGLTDLALTTNGVRLAAHARALRDAGLGRVTVSLDTLHADRFERLTRTSAHAAVLDGIAAAAAVFGSLKIDTVILRGVNDDELVPLLEFAAGIPAEVRFIEYMDVGGATGWSWAQVVTRREMLDRLTAHYGPMTALEHTSAPADRFRLPDGRTFGIISSTSQPFCADCDRARVTADGQLFTCLYATRGLDLRAPLRSGTSDADLAALIDARWTARRDRGAEERLALERRSAFVPLAELRGKPHLEMHTRGG